MPNLQILPPNTDDLTPVTVVVTDTRWDAIGEPTQRNMWLTNMLSAMGGVNESVSPGTYHFNVLDVDGVWIATLTPAPTPI